VSYNPLEQNQDGPHPRTYHLLTAAHTARVCFDRPEGASEVGACFGCVACEVLLNWVSEGSFWSCPDCGQELYPDEGRFLVERSQHALSRLYRNLGGRTWLSQQFRRILRLGP
jgi:predicted RNA-binding Zn-ribbon protein involved in translation (DUF1610 family)